MSEQSTTEAQWNQEAYQRGVDAAKAAASWTVDRNTDIEAARNVVKMFDDGDPAVFDYLPPMPDLSGQWADNPTPRSLFEDITGLDAHAEASFNYEAYARVTDALADAWEAGVSSTFLQACEAELRRFIS